MKKKKADPDTSVDLYGSDPDEEIKEAEEDLEKIKEQKKKEIEEIEEQNKQVEIAKKEEKKAHEATVVVQEHLRRWEQETSDQKVLIEHHSEYSINE